MIGWAVSLLHSDSWKAFLSKTPTWFTAIELHPHSEVIVTQNFHNHNRWRYSWQRDIVSLNGVCIFVSRESLKLWQQHNWTNARFMGAEFKSGSGVCLLFLPFLSEIQRRIMKLWVPQTVQILKLSFKSKRNKIFLVMLSRSNCLWMFCTWMDT